jgi:hypothetical protein
MDGFKNTTKTSYDTASGRKFANGGMTVARNDMPGGQGPMNKPAMVAKYAKGGHVTKGEQKIGRVMEEFTKGKLHSGSKEGPKVKSTKQAVAIALNEARAAGAKIPRVKRAEGTPMGKGPEEGDVLMARMTKDELAMGRKGVKMAQERLAKREMNMPKKAVPVAKREPIISRMPARDMNSDRELGLRNIERMRKAPAYGPAPSLTIPLKKGGLSVMPKNKGGMC